MNKVTTAVLIGLRYWSAKAAALGGAGAVMMFLSTAVVLIFDTGMGTEPRWVSGALGISRTVPVERRGIAGSGTLVAW